MDNIGANYCRKQISDWRDTAKPGEVLEMPNLTGFQRLLAYQEVDHRYVYFNNAILN